MKFIKAILSESANEQQVKSFLKLEFYGAGFF